MSAGTAERREIATLASIKIGPRHQERLAIVYVRQSHPSQLVHHPESTRVQYNLTEHAIALGWSRDRVLVIDDDQGRTATNTEGDLASSASSPRSASILRRRPWTDPIPSLYKIHPADVPGDAWRRDRDPGAVGEGQVAGTGATAASPLAAAASPLRARPILAAGFFLARISPTCWR